MKNFRKLYQLVVLWNDSQHPLNSWKRQKIHQLQKQFIRKEVVSFDWHHYLVLASHATHLRNSHAFQYPSILSGTTNCHSERNWRNLDLMLHFLFNLSRVFVSYILTVWWRSVWWRSWLQPRFAGARLRLFELCGRLEMHDTSLLMLVVKAITFFCILQFLDSMDHLHV